ncbi:TonB-dependent receptor domain-containing protein [Sphingomonas sp. LY160]|uniref:TonB-dependent receptor domain-containing protein n=1 Tax=Sphingomonas sp. LY160 TaxID=3095342 RepID=UPI002ADEF8EA|nr:TonB-dependent receptor [Sphingomonas sp. LY160]MEA1072868.1 TonB-dependent receptor [Sphingomonas sp. LY160]
MTKHPTLAAALLATSALVAAPAFAQTAPPSSPSASTVGNPADPEVAQETADQAQPGAQDANPVEISGPGADDEVEEVIVRGRNIPNPVRSTPEVVSVLSAEDIARTGEGDIAGALQRVTGLSLVGGRFVYVRGLGERYSLALLNGSPLPSPEPLRRVVPLDLFPTSIIASTVIQKSFSANYPGEFGGGVINLTTRTAPKEGFLDIGFGVGGDTETTGQLGYTYFGSDSDFTGFDDGARNLPSPLASAIRSGNRLVVGPDFSVAQVQEATASLVNAPTTLIQRNNEIPVNGSFDIAGGESFSLGAVDVGIIAVAGISNSWRTRGGVQQAGTRNGTPGGADEGLSPSSDFRYLSTQNRMVVNGMANLSFQLDRHKLRFTNIFIRDTLKEARIATGNSFDTVSQSAVRPDGTLNTGATSWYERQLFDSQVTGEFRFGDLSIDLRGSYAKTKRDAPYERNYSYVFDDVIGDYVNDLRSPGQNAQISFSTLDDKLWYGGIDVAYRLYQPVPVTVSAGYAFTDNTRSAIRRDFEYFPDGVLNAAVAQQRIDYLLSDFNVYNYGVLLRETTGGLGSAAYDAALKVNAGYLMAEIEPVKGVTLNLGVRYEDGDQSVTPAVLFGQPAAAASRIRADYFLPAGTLTWNFADDMQLRLAASKTIARPQFRELAPQPYRDTESQRTFFGNQFLVDSEIFNLDARYEWYFGRDQILSVAGFYKDIKNPIETTAVNLGSSLVTSFANAPKATLYGAELEFRKYFPFRNWGVGGWLADRRITAISNYTFTDSEIKIEDGDQTISFTSQPNPIDANLVFDTSRKLRLTGQSRHLLNLQLGLENTERLSQQSLLLTYASKRATNRGPNLTPDFIEKPGVQLDVVLREAIPIYGKSIEFKLEGRNLLGTDYEEVQTLNDSRLIIQQYDVGRAFSLSATLKL